jgi:hypothetical protein
MEPHPISLHSHIYTLFHCIHTFTHYSIAFTHLHERWIGLNFHNQLGYHLDDLPIITL